MSVPIVFWLEPIKATFTGGVKYAGCSYQPLKAKETESFAEENWFVCIYPYHFNIERFSGFVSATLKTSSAKVNINWDVETYSLEEDINVGLEKL